MSRLLRPLFTCGGFLPRTLSEEAQKLTEYSEFSNPFKILHEPDLYWMFEALLASMAGVGHTAPNPAVGCVLVKNGFALSKGATEPYRLRHAERVAFDKVADKDILKHTTAYVTLEPCAHVGHQPACSAMVAHSSLSRLVAATLDPNPKVAGTGCEQVRLSGKSVDVGPLCNEARAWNLPFFFEQHERRPLLVAKWAQTLDGCLCDDNSQSQWISGPAARSYTHWLRQKYDIILVGAGTVLNDAPRLNARDCALPINRQPLRAFFDPNGRILSEATPLQVKKIVENILSQKNPFIYVTKSNTNVTGAWPSQFLKHAIVVRCDALETLVENLQINEEVQKALDKPLQSVFVEGGPRLISALLERQLVDLAHIFMAPLFIGGTRGRAAPQPIALAEAKHWTLVAQERLGQDTLLECMPTPHARKIFELE